jgi:hypothetical protein
VNDSLTATTAELRVRPDVPAGSSPAGALCDIAFDNRRIWTFRVSAEQWDATSSTLTVAWPPALVPHLAGSTCATLEIRPAAGAPASWSVTTHVAFGPETEPLTLTDPLTGAELVVNKWGRLAKSFEAADDTFKASVLGSALELVEAARAALGLELFATGGTLLGLVRDGKLIESDDDADLAYVSTHENPSDVVLESYALERALAAAGFEAVRHSSGHLQVMFGGTELSDGYYVDIFTYFVTEGWFYGTFHAREKASDVTIFPLGTVPAGSIALPAPASPEQMLAAIYGPDWRTPDPAFAFDTPEASGRRFYWWLNHFDMFREDWEDYHRAAIGAQAPTEPSALALWLGENLVPGTTVVEFGTGLGADARFLAAAGHSVLATDFSRPAVVHSRTLAADSAAPIHFEVANNNSVRDMAGVVKQAAALAGPDARIDVVARNLFDNLHYLGRDTTLMSISHLLDRGGRAYLQMRNPKSGRVVRDAHEPIGERIFEPWEFTHRLAFYGLEVETSNFITEPGAAGSSISYIIRKATRS